LSYDTIPHFGLLYDSVPAYASRTDVSFYVSEAAAVTGMVLELGCGTGRVLLPLARAGHRVVGVDSSQEMLDRCAAKLLEEADSIRGHVTLHRSDVRSFDVGATCDLAIAPFRVMQHLATIEDQLHFLAAVRTHLVPGGRFVFDVFNTHFSALAAVDGIEREDTPEQRLPDGRWFRRTARVVRVRWVEQISEIELIYYVSPAPGAPANRHVHAFDMRWYLRAELDHLLTRAGFRVEAIYGDFARGALSDDSPELVVCARRL